MNRSILIYDTKFGTILCRILLLCEHCLVLIHYSSTICILSAILSFMPLNVSTFYDLSRVKLQFGSCIYVLCFCVVQVVREARELDLIRYSFTSDIQVFSELDEIAGVEGCQSYTLEHIVTFLRSKSWKVEELEDVEDVGTSEMDRQSASATPVAVRQNKHIVFPSSSDDDDQEVLTEAMPVTDEVGVETVEGDTDVGAEEEEPEEQDEQEEEEDDEEGPGPSERATRSAYVGRGNVQAVRTARKNAGLSAAFPRSDKLLTEFADFLKASSAAPKDISNKASLRNVKDW